MVLGGQGKLLSQKSSKILTVCKSDVCRLAPSLQLSWWRHRAPSTEHRCSTSPYSDLLNALSAIFKHLHFLAYSNGVNISSLLTQVLFIDKLSCPLSEVDQPAAAVAASTPSTLLALCYITFSAL